MYVNGGSATLRGAQVAANNAPKGSAIYQCSGTIIPTTALTITGDIYQAGGRFAGSHHDLRIAGALVLAGGDFYAPDAPNELTLTGPYTHTGGTYHQIQPVNDSGDVGFPKACGVIINANGYDLGSTEVADTAGADCAGVTPGEAVQHCYTITPTTATGRAATLTLYYQTDDAKPGHDCCVMEAYRWTGSWNTMLVRDESYSSGGRLCGSDPQSIRAAFVIQSGGDAVTVTTSSTYTVQVAFDPSSTGALSANLSIQSDDSDEGTVNVALSGTEVGPEITVAPLSLTFGEQDVHAGATVSQTVTITNDGLDDLHISAVTPSGDTDTFNLVDSGESTLMPGSTRTIAVAFDPGQHRGQSHHSDHSVGRQRRAYGGRDPQRHGDERCRHLYPHRPQGRRGGAARSPASRRTSPAAQPARPALRRAQWSR